MGECIYSPHCSDHVIDSKNLTENYSITLLTLYITFKFSRRPECLKSDFSCLLFIWDYLYHSQPLIDCFFEIKKEKTNDKCAFKLTF